PLVLITISAPSVVTVPAKAWAETARARALAAKPAKCLRIIQNSPLCLASETHEMGSLCWGESWRRLIAAKWLLDKGFMTPELSCEAHSRAFRQCRQPS